MSIYPSHVDVLDGSPSLLPVWRATIEGSSSNGLQVFTCGSRSTPCNFQILLSKRLNLLIKNSCFFPDFLDFFRGRPQKDDKTASYT